jgi:hypothetical protein
MSATGQQNVTNGQADGIYKAASAVFRHDTAKKLATAATYGKKSVRYGVLLKQAASPTPIPSGAGVTTKKPKGVLEAVQQHESAKQNQGSPSQPNMMPGLTANGQLTGSRCCRATSHRSTG